MDDPCWYYRVTETLFEDGPRLYLNKYKVVKITPQGVKILVREYSGERKQICNKWKKRYACPTIEEAKISYIARKKRQIEVLESQLFIAKECHDKAIRDEIPEPETYTLSFKPT